MPFKVRKPILACGADMKGAFAIAQGKEALLVDGFGDLSDLDNFTSYEKAVKSQLKKMKIRPEIVACDLHPGYHSTYFVENYMEKMGQTLFSCKLYSYENSVCPYFFKIQHHEAHIASAIVDHSLKGNVIGVAFDGTGYGSDGNIWGGEFFIGDLEKLKRVAHFEYIAMPGGDKAVTEPWRMAASYLYHAYGKPRRLLSATYAVDMVSKWPILKKMIDQNLNSPLTSSAGRLFDAVGSMILSKERAAFEAELPVELEKMVIELCQDRYDFDIKSRGGILIVDFSKMIRKILKDLSGKIDKSTISSKFHNTIANVILEVSIKLRKSFKIDKVVLSGGVFQNKFLTARAVLLLRNRGFDVYAHSKIPTNDSGIPIGQVAIAQARVRCV